jgi:hypothetical protein
MNPLKPADVQRLKMALQDWLKQIDGHEPPPVDSTRPIKRGRSAVS